VLLLLLFLLPVNACWIIQSEVIRYAGHPTTTSLFYNVVFWLCVLLVGNRVAGAVSPRLTLRRNELLTLYVILQLTSALGGHDTAEVLLPILAHATRYADNANDWASILLPNLPHWLVVTDKDAVQDFYSGHVSFYSAAYLRAWAVPILCWTGLFGVLTCTMLCLNVLLRKQWTERERLPFPLVALPLEMTAPGTPFWREPLLWLGIVAAVGLQLWNGLAVLNPAVPGIQLKYIDIGPSISQRPWSAIGWLPLGFYPFGIALGVLLPVDFLFSSWFFFWFWKIQFVVSAAMAWDQTPDFPYVHEQSLGAYLGVALTVLWTGRRHFLRVLNHFIDPKGYPLEPGEENDSPISYRAACVGVLVGVAALAAFCLTAGMSPLVFGAFFVIYFGIAFAVTRMRAELGPPVHDLHQSGPETVLPNIFSPTSFDRPTLAVFSLCFGFNRAYRGHPMPIQLEGFAIAQRGERDAAARRVFSRQLFFCLLAAGFVGPLVAFWALLHLGYAHGAASGEIGPPNVLSIFGSEAWGRYTSWVRVPQPARPPMGLAVVVGMGFALLLNAVRIRVIGFPFHPIGYAVASSWGMNVLWMPMLLAWVVKVLVLRYGGLGLYRRVLPLCYGVIIGECVAGSLWTIVGILFGVPTYAFWP
jgi:hypothetical protein